jgi:hypothetical protein
MPYIAACSELIAANCKPTLLRARTEGQAVGIERQLHCKQGCVPRPHGAEPPRAPRYAPTELGSGATLGVDR